MLNAELENGILQLKKELEKEMRKDIGDKILLEYYTRLFSASSANLLLDPNPIELACSGTKAGTTRNYIFQIKDIIAIKSDKRLKSIYLKRPIRSKEGGEVSSKIYQNNNDEDWNALLFKIQRNSQFIFRVQKSHAINIFDYVLQADNSFELAEALRGKIEGGFHNIPTDSFFDKTAYYKRLVEIDYLYNVQLGFRLDYEKIREVSDYIKTLHVTKEE